MKKGRNQINWEINTTINTEVNSKSEFYYALSLCHLFWWIYWRKLLISSFIKIFMYYGFNYCLSSISVWVFWYKHRKTSVSVNDNLYKISLCNKAKLFGEKKTKTKLCTVVSILKCFFLHHVILTQVNHELITVCAKHCGTNNWFQSFLFFSFLND